MPETGSTSKTVPPWAWVGCGCVGAVGAFFIVVGGLGFWGFQRVRDMSETMSDPVARNEQALEVLGAESLPDGYDSVAVFSVPFAFDYVVLSSQPSEDEGLVLDSDTNGFLFMSFPAVGDGDKELYDFFEGRSDDVASLRREQFNLDLRERVAAGRLARENDEILWVSHLGSVSTDTIDAAGDGLVTMMLFECNDSRRRLGVWSGPAAADSTELAGSVADEVAIESFTLPFNPCH